MDDFFNHIINLHKNRLFQKALNEINSYEINGLITPELLNLKGVTLFFLNRYEDSLKISQEALDKLDKGKFKNRNLNIAILNLQAQSYSRLAKYNKAIISYNKILEKDSANIDALLNIGSNYAHIGEKKKSAEYYARAYQINPKFKQTKDYLIKSLSYCSNINEKNNIIVQVENEIQKINFEYCSESLIKDEMIFSIFEKQNRMVDKYLEDIKINSTQTFRKEKLENLNCERHKKIFFEQNVIPEYCFSCFKILIKPESILELIKVYIIFDNLNLPLKNERKCMIELRDNVEGIYKAFIYCKTIEECTEILDEIKKLIKKNIGKNLNVEIKRGCSEYSKKFKSYKNLKELYKYNLDWKKIEKEYDLRYPYLKDDFSDKIVKKGSSIRDVLTMRNWVYFAFLNKDKTYNLVSRKLYKSDYLEKRVIHP